MDFFFENPPPASSADFELPVPLNPPVDPITPEEQVAVDTFTKIIEDNDFRDAVENWFQDRFGASTDDPDFFINNYTLETIFNTDFVNGNPLADRAMLEFLEALLGVDDIADTFQEAVDKVKTIEDAVDDYFNFFGFDPPPNDQPPQNDDEDELPEKEPEEKPEDVED